MIRYPEVKVRTNRTRLTDLLLFETKAPIINNQNPNGEHLAKKPVSVWIFYALLLLYLPYSSAHSI
jgi:hypothetical protein